LWGAVSETESTLRDRLAALERENTMLKAALKASPAGILIATAPDGVITHWNPAAIGIRGADADTLTDIPIASHPKRWQTFHPDGTLYRPEELPLSRAILSEETCFGEDVIIRDGGGLERWVSGHAAPIYNDDVLIGGVVVFPDITERKNTELALRRFRRLTESSPDLIAMVREDGGLLYLNPAGRRLRGIGQETDISQESLAAFFPAREARLVVQHGARKALDAGLYQTETTLLGPDGGSFPVALTMIGHPPNEREAAYLSVVMQDLRPIHQLQRQLNKSQRLEALGRLAGGVAHDFNNMLTIITNYTELIREGLPEGDQRREDTGHILLAAERSAALCKQLLSFARRQIIQPQELSLPAVVDEMTRLFRRTLSADIILSTALQPDLWPIWGDRSQLDQVLMNLVVNARDAMPSGGELLIEAENAVLDEHYAAAHPDVVPGEYLMIAISDTGVGMPASVQARAFEPFFTTKGDDNGTGLGLATVHGAVRQNHGHIWLYSEEGQGTIFKLYWPRAQQPAAAVEPPAESQRTGSGTVLVVEDEELLRKLTVRLLRSGGYTVLEASDGPTALGIAAAHRGKIDLLLTDVIMPRMNGKVLSEMLKVSHPGTRVLFVSGYTENTIVNRGVLDQGVEFLAKPFSRSALLSRIGELLI